MYHLRHSRPKNTCWRIAELRRKANGTASIGAWMPRGFLKSRNDLDMNPARQRASPAPAGAGSKASSLSLPAWRPCAAGSETPAQIITPTISH